jgi:uncharacterized membrane protein YfcA
MNPVTGLLTGLGALTVVFVGGWAKAVLAARQLPAGAASPATDARAPSPLHLGTGFVTNFFDTLGVSSFATTTAIFRLKRLVPDRIIPGTLNAGHTLPTVAQAFIYTSVIPVDVVTLFSMITAAVLGAWLGAGVVARWPKRSIQMGMGIALIVAATLMLITQVQALTGRQVLPLGGDALGVRGTLLVVAVTGNFLLGALMTLGIGLYAPCMILISLLGMNPTTAFPIMMGSCAFLMPVGSLRFIRERSYSLRSAVGLAIGGVPGVLIAAYIVKSLPLGTVRWLVIVVVLYTAVTMLMSAASEKRANAAEAVEA